MKVSDYIATTLYRKGVRHVFELSGGMITHLLDSLYLRKQIAIVSMRHEQAAAFAADACGRMTGVPGVAMATSGPGATNLLTGVGSCYFDSSPAVFLTGQVNRNEQKKDRSIRQLGFQETDIVTMARPITKATWRVETPDEVPGVLDRAFAQATAGRPGPVLIDIPMDVQRADIDPDCQPGFSIGDVPVARAINYGAIRKALEQAQRPIILAGGGIRAARAASAFRRAANKLGIPVVHSLMGVDVLPQGHLLRVGLIGTYGNRWANLALGQSDFILVLGSRLDVRQTGSQVEAFKNGRVIVHVDCEAGEINNRINGCEPVVAELGSFLEGLGEIFQVTRSTTFREKCARWIGEIERLHRAWPDTAEMNAVPGINPNVFMHALSGYSQRAAAYVVDVGQHQMWAAQSLEPGSNQRFLTSGGMGSMGFALPAAIGVALSAGGESVVVIAGDGGFQCNLQELQTVAHLHLPLKIVVINNGCHGMVRQFQESYFDGRYQSTYWGYSAPDFAKVASAYGICGATVAAPEAMDENLRWLWADAAEPRLLQVMVDMAANAYPKIAFGKPITEMEPFSKSVEISRSKH